MATLAHHLNNRGLAVPKHRWGNDAMMKEISCQAFEFSENVPIMSGDGLRAGKIAKRKLDGESIRRTGQTRNRTVSHGINRNNRENVSRDVPRITLPLRKSS